MIGRGDDTVFIPSWRSHTQICSEVSGSSTGEYVNVFGEVIKNESGSHADQNGLFYYKESTIEDYIRDIEIQYNRPS